MNGKEQHTEVNPSVTGQYCSKRWWNGIAMAENELKLKFNYGIGMKK